MWKTIARYPAYEINKNGDIRRKDSNVILKPYPVEGHLKVKLSGSTEYVSRLVAESFLRKRKARNEVRHINRRRDDNRVENLSWANHKEIQKDIYQSGIHPRGGAMPPKKIRNVETGEVYPSIRFCAKVFHTGPNSIRKCLKNRDKTIDGIHLEIIERG